MKTLIRPAFTMLVFFTFLTGLAYPLWVTAIAHIVFPKQADGSLLCLKGRRIGSSLIGQNFTEPQYFWGRLSATDLFPYNAFASGGTNYGAMHPALIQAAKERVEALRSADAGAGKNVPVDLATASGSGLDPDISVAAAEYQASRIAKERRLPLEKVLLLIQSRAQKPFLGFLGPPRVNVLRLNLALDANTRS